MRRFSFVAVFLIVTGALIGPSRPCAAQKTVVSSRKAAALLHGVFRPIKTVAGLPPAVKRAFPSRDRQRDFHMADSGKPFQVTDVVTDNTLPWRGVVFAGVSGVGDRASGRRCFVFYKRGGRGHSCQLLILNIAPYRKTARLLWRGFCPASAKSASVDALRNALTRGEFRAMSISDFAG